MYETEVVNVSDNDSNSSDDVILPLSERIKKLSQVEDKKKRFTSLKTHCASAHSISDSEEENESPFCPNKASSDEDDPVLPDLSSIFFNHKQQRSLSGSSSSSKLQSPPFSIEAKDLFVQPSTKVQNQPITNFEDSAELSDILTQAPKRSRISPQTKKILELEKKAKQEKRIKERELKKKEKELDKALKAAEREVKKNSKPEEYTKLIKVAVDGNLVAEDDISEFFTELENSNLNYAIEANHIKLSVVWYRHKVHISVENDQVCKDEREELENILVVFIPNNDFVGMVHATVQLSKGKQSCDETLLNRLASIKAVFPLIDITCVTVGLDKYLREYKNASSDGSVTNKKPSKRVTKNNIEEAMIEVQLQMFVNFKLLSNMKEFGQLLHHYTKAIAAAPSKKEKNDQKDLAFSWYADADSSCPVKLEKDGGGGIKLWKQQIQQFNNVGNQVAESIVAKYPSPKLLIEAYKNCSSKQEAQKLLQDIVVRREYGPLGTQRKIGPELSYKIHLFFTSTNENQFLQR